MPKFRKKPIIIEAEQFWPYKLPWPEGVIPNDPTLAVNTKGVIKTLEGWLTVSPGDWIIRGIAGEFYPCKPDIFAKTYEPVEG